jgi:hypothetical protein
VFCVPYFFGFAFLNSCELLVLKISFPSFCLVDRRNVLYGGLFSHCSPIRNKEYGQWRYTGCPRSNVPDFGRVFLMLKYTDITQNTYNQSWTVTEIMAREKCGLLAVPRTAPLQLARYMYTAHVRPSSTDSSVTLQLEYQHVYCLEP